MLNLEVGGRRLVSGLAWPGLGQAAISCSVLGALSVLVTDQLSEINVEKIAT